MGNRQSKLPLQPVKCAICCAFCAVIVGPALLEGGTNWEACRALMEENFYFFLQGLGSVTPIKCNCSN
jgi:hypothetical protein